MLGTEPKALYNAQKVHCHQAVYPGLFLWFYLVDLVKGLLIFFVFLQRPISVDLTFPAILMFSGRRISAISRLLRRFTISRWCIFSDVFCTYVHDLLLH